VKKIFLKFIYISLSLILLLNITKKNNQVAAKFILNAKVEYYQDANNSTGRCYGPTFKEDVPIHVEIKDIYINGEAITQPPTTQPAKGVIFYFYKATLPFTVPQANIKEIDSNGIITRDLTYKTTDDDKLIKVTYRNDNITSLEKKLLKERITVVPADEIDDLECFLTPPEDFGLCEQISGDETELIKRCRDCFAIGGVWTAVGCVPNDPESVISTVIEIGLTLSGAIVLIMILAGAFMLSTSQGDPKKTQEAKELITSAIIGLLFVIFSITILKFIGVSVFRLPGFGEL